MRDKQLAKIYMREMCGAMLVYAVVLVAAIRIGRPMDAGALRTLVLVSPMIGCAMVLWAVIRHVGRLDELFRRVFVESVAVAAAIVAGLTFTYGFLETAGFARISMFAVLPALFGVAGAIFCFRTWLHR